jgi:hypothetical protein
MTTTIGLALQMKYKFQFLYVPVKKHPTNDSLFAAKQHATLWFCHGDELLRVIWNWNLKGVENNIQCFVLTVLNFYKIMYWILNDHLSLINESISKWESEDIIG